MKYLWLVACLPFIVECSKKDPDYVYQIFERKADCSTPCVKEPSGSWCLDSQKTRSSCNANKTVEWVRQRKFTKTKGPCKGECQKLGSSYSCTHYFKGSDACDPKASSDYIIGQTSEGKFCVGKCRDHDLNGKRWCFNEDGQKGHCSLPAMPRPREWDAEVRQLLSCKNPFMVDVPVKRVKRADETRADYDRMNQMAWDLEQNQEYDFVFVRPADRDMGDPIYSYTLSRGDVSRRIPVVPRVVRADVFPRHLRKSANRPNIPSEIYENMEFMGKLPGDHAGHLIAYSLSGPFLMHNFVPQRISLNLSLFSQMEREIRTFLNGNTDGHVDMLVIPMYDNGQTRPFGVSMLIRMFKDAVLIKQSYAYLPNTPDGVKVTSITGTSTTPAPSGGLKLFGGRACG